MATGNGKPPVMQGSNPRLPSHIMKYEKSLKREKAQKKARHGMRVRRGGLVHIQNAIRNRARKETK